MRDYCELSWNQRSVASCDYNFNFFLSVTFFVVNMKMKWKKYQEIQEKNQNLKTARTELSVS